MNWYELADAAEVQEVLVDLLSTYGFSNWTYAYDAPKDENGESVRLYSYPKEKFEIAEALWGEYGEEIL
jgi:hypothetical protein